MGRWRSHLELGALGLAFGATLSSAGLTSFGELHRFFTLADPRLALTFGGAVALAGAGLALHGRGVRLPHRPIRAGTIPGAAAFGAGLALCGGCPGVALAMLGEGQLGALLVLAGILAGTRLGHALQGWLGWDGGSCA